MPIIIGTLTRDGVHNQLQVNGEAVPTGQLDEAALAGWEQISNCEPLMWRGPVSVHEDGLRWAPVIEQTDGLDACGEDWVEVRLLVVPVSVPDDLVISAVGCTEDEYIDRFLPLKDEDGDWRQVAEDLVRHGSAVSVWSETLRFGGEDADDRPQGWEQQCERLVEKAKVQALAVRSLFGFYMDRPVNRAGETGWDWLRRARAFPGQQLRYRPTDMEERTTKCADCAEERPCREYERPERVRLCAPCVEGYYQCTCDRLLSITAQSYAGVEWVDLEGGHLCRDCALNALRHNPGLPELFAGGPEVTHQTLAQHAVHCEVLGSAPLTEEGHWAELGRWDIGLYSHNRNEDEAIAEVLRLAQEAVGGRLLWAAVSCSQFETTYALFRRRGATDGD